MTQPVKSPIDPALVARIANGTKDPALMEVAPHAWFGPQDPLPPSVPQAQQASVEGRQFDYPIGYNLWTRPRQNEVVTFEQMRALADGYDLLRLVIETRKDQLAKLKWKIRPRDTKAKPDARCAALTEFFLFPDREHTWDDWLRMLMEDLFVLDAPALYARPTRGGGLYGLEPLDGATIKRVIDEHGRTPMPPLPAYQQILHGVAAIDYTRDELIYKPRNLRTHKIYGYGPVEQIIVTVNIALRRQVHQLQYYTDGSTPDLIFSVPSTWNPDQIARFKTFWDSMLFGNTANRRGTMFVPDGAKPLDTKEKALKDEYDEWLARIVCFAFSVAPTPFIKAQNRATADSAKEQALEEGLAPLRNWVKSLVDSILLRFFDAPNLEFAWDEEEMTNPLEQAQVQDVKVRNGTLTVNEARAMDGKEPVDGGDAPLIFTGGGAIALRDAQAGRAK
jgi:hypothetical protein